MSQVATTLLSLFAEDFGSRFDLLLLLLLFVPALFHKRWMRAVFSPPPRPPVADSPPNARGAAACQMLRAPSLSLGGCVSCTPSFRDAASLPPPSPTPPSHPSPSLLSDFSLFFSFPPLPLTVGPSARCISAATGCAARLLFMCRCCFVLFPFAPHSPSYELFIGTNKCHIAVLSGGEEQKI